MTITIMMCSIRLMRVTAVQRITSMHAVSDLVFRVQVTTLVGDSLKI
jgi:hypothetical protein